MTTLTKLYHVEIGIPRGIPLPTPGMDLTYSMHAKDEAKRDGLHVLPTRLPPFNLIEVEMLGDLPVKWVVRCSLNAREDLVLVLVRSYTVLTVWVNAKSDTHATLDRLRYTQP